MSQVRAYPGPAPSGYQQQPSVQYNQYYPVGQSSQPGNLYQGYPGSVLPAGAAQGYSTPAGGARPPPTSAVRHLERGLFLDLAWSCLSLQGLQSLFFRLTITNQTKDNFLRIRLPSFPLAAGIAVLLSWIAPSSWDCAIAIVCGICSALECCCISWTAGGCLSASQSCCASRLPAPPRHGPHTGWTSTSTRKWPWLFVSPCSRTSRSPSAAADSTAGGCAAHAGP